MRILFVENHAVLAATVKARFLADHEVTTCASIAEARACVEREDPDAVLVDYDLDDGKGDELVRWMRARGYGGRIIAVSAREEGNAALLRAGADACCPKSSLHRVESHLEDCTLDRARGALLGTLIGDALGRPFEGTPGSDRERLRRTLAQRLEHPIGWGHSDDGEMMLALAASVIARGGVDEAHVLASLAERCDPARGYGKGARAAFRVWREGGSVEDAGRALWPEGSRGNGGAVRVAPIAIQLRREDERVVAEQARRAASPTHAHDDARDGAAIVAAAVHRAVRGLDPPSVVAGLGAHARGELAGSVALAWTSRDGTPDAVIERIGHGVTAVESVPAALWACAAATSFTDAVVRAVELGGDADSIGAMAGAVAGALYGAAAIPESWVGALEGDARVEVERFARALVRERPGT